jgi:Bifunctional DNA primase/polymerase, N-terminal.
MQGKELLYKTAKRGWELGLNMIPCSTQKSPLGEWKIFQNRMITDNEFLQLYGGAHGVGTVCGKVSLMLEVIDIDHKYDLTGNLVNDYFKLIHDTDPDLFNSLYIARTPSNGYHIYYRCEVIEGNQKLAKRPTTDEERQANPREQVKVLIETRGEGGFIVCPPTRGYEPWQKNEIPTISVSQRDFLINAARSFNEVYDVAREPRQQYTKESPWEIAPWTEYDQRGDIVELLEKHDWRIDRKVEPRIYFTRPGKDKGVSGDYNKTLRLFKAWSTSQNTFEESKAYSHTAVYALLECGGDFSKACEQLVALGYGKRKPVTLPYGAHLSTEQESLKVSRPAGSPTPGHPQVYNGSIHPLGTRKVAEPEKTPEELFKAVYIPNWENRPEPKPALVLLGGTGLLTHQNIVGVIAAPGMGKSSCVESIGANLLNPECDSMGFTVDPSCNGILIIDNERTDADVWNSYYRIHKRAGLDRNADTSKITLAGLRFVARLDDRKKIIEQLIIEKQPSIVIIDGAGDLVQDTNNLEQAMECRVWMRDLTVRHKVSIITTLHPNPTSNKPRGHQGSEICREAESVLLIKPYDNDTKIITTEFEYGKNRNNPKLTTAFRWSDQHKMFMSADFDDVQENKLRKRQDNKRDELVGMAREVLPAPTAMKHDELSTVIQEKYEVSEKTARRRIKDMVDMTVIKSHDDNRYRLIIN